MQYKLSQCVKEESILWSISRASLFNSFQDPEINLGGVEEEAATGQPVMIDEAGGEEAETVGAANQSTVRKQS